MLESFLRHSRQNIFRLRSGTSEQSSARRLSAADPSNSTGKGGSVPNPMFDAAMARSKLALLHLGLQGRRVPFHRCFCLKAINIAED
jgi:hypothetical protein